MADGWVRAAVAGPTNFFSAGSVPLIGVSPDQTVLRAWWNIGMYFLVADVNAYPPGNSLLRAGVVYDVAGLTAAGTPFPITNADADWMAITTINPTVVQLSRATNVAWQINWGFPIDLSIKSQRKNDTAVNYTMYMSWEFALDDDDPDFLINGWWGSIDAYVRTP
jgi:hypothetical protein